MKAQKVIILTLLVMLTFTNNGICQKKQKKIKCRLDVDKVDAFSGDTIKDKYLRYIWRGAVLGFSRVGKNYIIHLNVSKVGDKKESVNQGDELFLKLNNGEMLTLKCGKEAKPDSRIEADQYSAEVYTYYRIEFPVSQEDLLNLINSPPIALKMNIAGEEKSLTFKEDDQKDVSDAVYCILH